MIPRTPQLRRTAALAVAAGALLAIPAAAQADLVIQAKTFSTQEAAPLSRTILATFSDDAAGAAGSFSCPVSTYTATIDWGDGTAPTAASIANRFGGDFALCEYTVTADHKYAHFGVYTTAISIAGGPLGHSGIGNGQITVADVGIAGEGQTFNATAGTAFVGQVAEFKDQNQLSQAGDFTASIDWGDGSPIASGVVGGKDGNFSVSGTHTYGSAGSFPVRVTFSHPTTAPAVALSTANVGAAPPNTNTNTNTNTNNPPFFTVFAVRGTARSGITLKEMKSKGLPVRVTAAAKLTQTVEFLRGTSKLGSVKLKLKKGINDVRVKPSSKLAKKLRAGRQYGLRIRAAAGQGGTQQLTFRIRAQR